MDGYGEKFAANTILKYRVTENSGPTTAANLSRFAPYTSSGVPTWPAELNVNKPLYNFKLILRESYFLNLGVY